MPDPFLIEKVKDRNPSMIIDIASGKALSLPDISHIVGNLFMGGTLTNDRPIPEGFKNMVCMHKTCFIGHETITNGFEWMIEDSENEFIDPDKLREVCKTTSRMLQTGPTLIHCQAGLNRSGLVAACTLIEIGWDPAGAVHLLREKRSPMALFNKSFEKLVYNYNERDFA